jgi:hypothetical protein
LGDNPDELLPLSRRLDWRFLLPDPTLNRVLYLGPDETLLIESLQRFSRSVAQVAGLQHDVAVLVNPSPRTFTKVLPTVGLFYIELSRPMWTHRVLHWAAPGIYLRIARKHGFQAQTYWQYPDFDAATRIIPLFELSPLLHVVSKDRRDLRTRMKMRGMAVLLKSGLLAHSVSCLSIVGYRA